MQPRPTASSRLRPVLALAITLATLAACGPAGPGPVPGTSPKPKASPKATGSAILTGTGPTRTIEGLVTPVTLTGKVKIVSDQGGGVVSNNGAAIISNNTGSIISDQGGGISLRSGSAIIGNNSSGLTSKTKWRLLAEGQPREFLLAEALVEVVDGEGRRLLDKAGKPIAATTDRQGNYTLTAALPAENFVLRIRLFPSAKTEAGSLSALLPRPTGSSARDIDTATSMGATYVLDRYVQNRQAVYNRLPADEAEALTRDVRTALGSTPVLTGYKSDEQVAAAEALRAKAPPLDETLERIKAILLAGQSDQGNGQQATTVALSNPFGVVGDARTTPPTLYIGETGRVRRIDAAGTIHPFAGGRTTSTSAEGDPLDVNLDAPGNLAIAADGSLYVADYVQNKVFKIKDGQLAIFAGSGARIQGAVGSPARDTGIFGPSQPVLTPDGRVYFGEFPKGFIARILYVGADGLLGSVPGPTMGIKDRTLVTGLAIAPDGTIWLLDSETNNDRLYQRTPDGAWSEVMANLPTTDTSRVVMGPDGALYMSQGVACKVMRFATDGTATVVAGNGLAGDGGDGGPANMAGLNEPSGLWFAPDGALYIADLGNGLIRKVVGLDGQGTITTVAGTRAATQQGDALALPLNTPGGLTFDPAGRLVVAEGSGGTIKRLEGNQMVVVAGSTRGFGGDGGPAKAAQFNAPSGLAYVGEDLYVLDAGNARVRRIGADGVVQTVAGQAGQGVLREPRVKADLARLDAGTACAAGPDGSFYWSDTEHHKVLRLTPDGFVEVVAGLLGERPGDSGDGGPASLAQLNSPVGLACDPAGNLYIADAANGRIRRVDKAGIITTVAGVPFGATLAGLLSGQTEPAESADAKEGWLIAPTALCFDKAGNLYISELGTAKLGTLIGTLGVAVDVATLPKKGARIRQLSGLDGPNPRLRTVAGDGSKLLAGPGTDNALLVPLGLAVDGEGRLIIADSGNNQIKLLPKGSF